ncbi:hypothetical protein Tco_1412546, partial [Tanacetum coccineum]
EQEIADYLEVKFSNQIHHLWELSPALTAASLPIWSRLFEVYASELLSQFKGKTANIRCCSCIDDNKEHTECSLVTNGNVSSRKTRARASTTEFEEEMKQDDEYYEQHVAGGTVAYMEMYLSNSGETYSTIKSLEGVASDFSATSFVLIIHQHKLRVKLYSYVMIIGVVVK